MSQARVTSETEENQVELIERLARKGRDDPTIAGLLGMTASKVRRLRADHDIPAGERRWLPTTPIGEAG